jgi:beta-glucuronidase
LFLLAGASSTVSCCAQDDSGITPQGELNEQAPKEVKKYGKGKVCLVKYSNNSWQLLVDGRPFFIRGIEYSPDKVGVRPKKSNEWMQGDMSGNGRSYGPYDSFIDENKNNVRDNGEKIVGDFKLLNEMGCNIIRIYHPDNINKDLLMDLYQNYGIYVIMGNFLGAYTVGSGAKWCNGTDYSNLDEKAKMLSSVKKMVQEFKDEPYVLMWMLGNENDTGGSCGNSTYNNTNASDNPKAYASFVGEVCRTIKSMDKDHPVAVCNGSYKILPYYKKYAPEIDIIGMNAYEGPYGFGVLWNRVRSYFDRPVLISEYGCDSYNLNKHAEDEDFQAFYHKNAWKDIEKNAYGGSGAGNSLGGVIYCWLDKWWLCGEPDVHDTDIGAWDGQTIDGKFKDEWMGVCSQGNGDNSPFVRQPKKVYYLYRNELWNETYIRLKKKSGVQ